MESYPAQAVGTLSTATTAVASVSSGSLPSGATPFEEALAEFKNELKKGDREKFRNVTRLELQDEIDRLQTQHHSDRRLRNLNRVKGFLEAMDQFDKVVQVFCQTSEIVAFVWGPMKFLLLVTNSFIEAFHDLLGFYDTLGNTLKLLVQGEELFPHDENMARVLAGIYKDILEFHRRALHYFQKPLWKQIFHATWKTYNTTFSELITGMDHHRQLLIGQITLSGFQEMRRIEERRLLAEKKRDQSAKRRELQSWLRADSPNMANDHRPLRQILSKFPTTGKWLFDEDQFKKWFNPEFPTIPPVLWLSGLPGAGKTVLTAHIIEEAKRLARKPVVLYFYCKDGDSERDNFVAIGRSLLCQLIDQAPDLLEYVFDKYESSNETVLSTEVVLEEIVEMYIRNCKMVYIILDGIDECHREQKKKISHWFRRLVEDLPPSHADQVRCLFVSQDDGIARKDFAGMAKFKITLDHIKGDIKEFSSHWAAKIGDKFKLPKEQRVDMADRITNSSGGMFLLAKLIAENLYYQPTRNALNAELEPNKFPTGVNEAYERIIDRILNGSTEAQILRPYCLKLLSWLVCAKRPLKWHEIQAANSIDLEAQNVDIEGKELIANSKELCGALVEEQLDGTVELVHVTAKFFLVDHGYVHVAVAELGFTGLCLDYLNLRAFRQPLSKTEARVLSGQYAFMDYAILYWVRHLEAGMKVACKSDDPDTRTPELNEEIHELGEQLGVFLELHYQEPETPLAVANRNQGKIKVYAKEEYYGKLEQALVYARKHLKLHDEMRPSEISLDLFQILLQVRKCMEGLLGPTADYAKRARLEDLYGRNLFKCSRPSCHYFTDGFTSADMRDRHKEKHERKWRCKFGGCPNSVLGFTTDKDLERHMKASHLGEEMEFPNEQELLRRPEPPPPPPPLESESELEPDEIIEEEEPPPPEPGRERSPFSAEPEPVIAREQSRKRVKRSYTCLQCGKVFTRNFNLQSHMHSHSTQRPWKCPVCGRGFARESDCRRHKKSHGEAPYRCSGTLRDGRIWGCGKGFARADTLSNHHKSRQGRSCIEPLLIERGSSSTPSGMQEAMEIDG